MNPNKTASTSSISSLAYTYLILRTLGLGDYNSLVSVAAQFHEFLRETGVGALPMLPLPKPSDDNGDAMALDLITPAVTNVLEEELGTKLNAEVDARYARQRRVMEHAAIVVNRNATKMSL